MESENKIPPQIQEAFSKIKKSDDDIKVIKEKKEEKNLLILKPKEDITNKECILHFDNIEMHINMKYIDEKNMDFCAFCGNGIERAKINLCAKCNESIFDDIMNNEEFKDIDHCEIIVKH